MKIIAYLGKIYEQICFVREAKNATSFRTRVQINSKYLSVTTYPSKIPPYVPIRVKPKNLFVENCGSQSPK